MAWIFDECSQDDRHWMKGSIMPALSGGMKNPGALDDEKPSILNAAGPVRPQNASRQLLTARINSTHRLRFKPVSAPVLFQRQPKTKITFQRYEEIHMHGSLSTGLLTGPNLVSCIGELSPGDYDDFSHCTQIATKSADMVSSRFANSQTWLNEYVSTLNFFGWSVFQDAITTRTRYDISKSVAEFLVQSAQRMQDTRQGNAMIDTLDALKPDQPALYSLDEESLMGERFQVIPARYDSKGFLEIAVFNLELVVHTKKNRFLFWDWENQAAKIIQQRAFLKLDKRKLEANRALIEKKRREIGMKRFELRKA